MRNARRPAPRSAARSSRRSRASTAGIWATTPRSRSSCGSRSRGSRCCRC